MRAGAWVAAWGIWPGRKCWSNKFLNSRSCSEGLPNLPSVLNLVCGQEEHVPTTGFLPCHLIITRLGFFMPSVSHRPIPITSPVDFKLHHYPNFISNYVAPTRDQS